VFFSNCKLGRIDARRIIKSDFDDGRQPEMTLWPHKPEVLLSPKVRQIYCRNSNGNSGVYDMLSSKKYRKLTATTTDSPKLKIAIWPPKPKIRNYISRITSDSFEIPKTNSAFSTTSGSTGVGK